MNVQPVAGDSDRVLPPLGEEEKEALLASAADDLRSADEAKQLTSGLSSEAIKKKAAEKEAGRTERFRDHFEGLAIVTLYIVWAILIAVGLAWVYHLFAPLEWYRLPDAQVKQLHSIVTGGILAGMAGGHLKKRLD